MKLTKDFSLHEFQSKDGADTPPNVFIQIVKTAKNLQVLRDYFNTKITINSGYRSPEHNKAIGGATNSQHLLGKAADIVVAGKTPKEVFAAIEELQSKGKMDIGGLHAYGTFTHFDHRGYKARW